jgi:hypothetical protein
MKSGSLNLLEPSGPVKACNGIASPLLFQVIAGPNPVPGTFEHEAGFLKFSLKILLYEYLPRNFSLRYKMFIISVIILKYLQEAQKYLCTTNCN